MTTVHSDQQRYEPTGPPPDGELATLASLMGELSAEARELIKLEVELAKAEVKEAAGHAAKAGAGFGAAAILAAITLFMLSFAAAWGLAEVMAPGWAFLIVGVVWALVATAAFMFGRKNLNSFDPVPHRTVATLREDITWLRHRNN